MIACGNLLVVGAVAFFAVVTVRILGTEEEFFTGLIIVCILSSKFNHRNTGKQMMNKVAKYIFKSHPITRRLITNALNAAFPIFTQ